MKQPYISKEVIEFLRYIWPDKMPDMEKCSYEEVLIKFGQVSVVRFLENIYATQKETEGELKVVI